MFNRVTLVVALDSAPIAGEPLKNYMRNTHRIIKLATVTHMTGSSNSMLSYAYHMHPSRGGQIGAESPCKNHRRDWIPYHAQDAEERTSCSSRGRHFHLQWDVFEGKVVDGLGSRLLYQQESNRNNINDIWEK